jgi:hypothetical protein
MIQIDGFWWFVGAVLVCGWHARYLRSWRRERKADLAWWQTYDARSQKRHEEFLQALDPRDACEWKLDGSRERGQA